MRRAAAFAIILLTVAAGGWAEDSFNRGRILMAYYDLARRAQHADIQAVVAAYAGVPGNSRPQIVRELEQELVYLETLLPGGGDGNESPDPTSPIVYGIPGQRGGFVARNDEIASVVELLELGRLEEATEAIHRYVRSDRWVRSVRLPVAEELATVYLYDPVPLLLEAAVEFRRAARKTDPREAGASLDVLYDHLRASFAAGDYPASRNSLERMSDSVEDYRLTVWDYILSTTALESPSRESARELRRLEEPIKLAETSVLIAEFSSEAEFALEIGRRAAEPDPEQPFARATMGLAHLVSGNYYDAYFPFREYMYGVRGSSDDDNRWKAFYSICLFETGRNDQQHGKEILRKLWSNRPRIGDEAARVVEQIVSQYYMHNPTPSNPLEDRRG